LGNEEDGYSDEEDFEAYTETILHPMDITARFDPDELQVVKQTIQSLPPPFLQQLFSHLGP
jgi:hypothetical protein